MPGNGRIMLVGKLKGGAGASTCTRELAASAAADGLKVAIIDVDSQGSSRKWWNRRSTDGDPRGIDFLDSITAEQIPAEADCLRQLYDIVLVDSPPSTHTLIQRIGEAADLAIIPSRPTVDDLDAVGAVFRLLHKRCDIGFQLSQIPPVARSRDAAEALELLAAIAPVLGKTTFRASYPRAAAVGSTAVESGDEASRQEIAGLWKRICDRLEIPARVAA